MALAENGVDIAFCDKDAEALRETEAEARALGRKVLAMEADVLDARAVARFHEAAARQFERIDILVNLAGGTKQRDFLKSTPEEDAADIRRNFGYVIQSIRAAVPRMRPGGSIINFTTIEAHRGAGSFSVYAGAKAGTSNLTKALAVELGPRGIRVNELAPDTTPSRGNAQAMRDDLFQKMTAAGEEAGLNAMKLYVPLGKPPMPEDIAKGVLFLASELSSMISGVTLHVDGGTGGALGFLNWPYDSGMLPTATADAGAALFSRPNPYPPAPGEK
jgi:NAD(P)-dependent dehydrogenase (short-subunit alcohol dehydrogenase family)